MAKSRMKTSLESGATLLAFLCLYTNPTSGHPYYREAIPNGLNVPHPCNKNLKWNGVGHLNRGGGGKRNPFGVDFKENGYGTFPISWNSTGLSGKGCAKGPNSSSKQKWDSVLCEKDSDGDGIKNGEELGDPGCVWRAGQNMIPTVTDQLSLSHPGICEPLDSPTCLNQNENRPDCTTTEFRCDAMDETGVIKKSLTLVDSAVPAKETTYMCMPVAFPDDAAYHMVAMTPNISNINVMHHAILYGCSSGVAFRADELNKPSPCFMGNREGCNDFIAIWALGIDGYCFHPQAGILLGKLGYKYAVIELHWNNPQKVPTYRDSSGLNIYITKNLRPYNASVLMIGEADLEIPPGEHKHTVMGTCSSECTQQYMTGPVNIFAATNHMHYLGISGHSRLIRSDSTEVNLAYDPEYSYDSPTFHSYDPIVMSPGDKLTMQCDYRTMTRVRTTYMGEETADEMCYAFLFYYPAENLNRGQCVSYAGAPPCANILSAVYNGCNFTRAFSQTITLAFLCLYIKPTVGHPYYREAIPNGLNVPHPCNKNLKWNGVGHFNRGGGGERNPFGEDFKENGFKWDSVLCEKDSDGDGIKNGEELGDPGCVWRAGQNMIPTVTEQLSLSHPGLCEPLDSSTCLALNKVRPDCNVTEFKCNAMEEEGMIKHTMTLPDYAVPAKETTYMCMPVAFPDDAAYHMVAMTPNISNINVMHHAILYGCSSQVTFSADELNKPSPCFMGNRRGCNDFIAIWALGIDGYCFHPQAGILLGKLGYKYAVIELHWNNPQKNPFYRDSSGLNIYITKTLRPYNASVLMIGETDLEIPYGEHKHTVLGTCSSECTQQYMTGPVNIFAATNHMHYLGSSGHSKLIRADNTEVSLAYDREYSYDSPTFQSYDPIVMNPGDKLTMQCDYYTMTRSETTYYGEETADEMCYAFMFYYPAENLQRDHCVSHGAIQPCTNNNPIVHNGCNFTRAMSTTDPIAVQRYVNITTNCVLHSCLKECLEVVRLVNEDPCYDDDGNRRLLKQFTYAYYETSADVLSYWGLLESCERQLARDSCPVQSTQQPGVTQEPTTCGVAGNSVQNLAVLICATFLVKMLFNI